MSFAEEMRETIFESVEGDSIIRRIVVRNVDNVVMDLPCSDLLP